MRAGVTVRRAVEADAPLILGFVRELAEYERLAHEVVATEERVRASLFSSRPAAEALIGELDGAPAGVAVFFHNYSTFLGRPGVYLEDLYVRPAVRGHGVGRELLRHLAALALERGAERLEWAVLDWNEPAIAFYRSLGAQPMSEWTVFRLAGPALVSLAHDREDGPSPTCPTPP